MAVPLFSLLSAAQLRPHAPATPSSLAPFASPPHAPWRPFPTCTTSCPISPSAHLPYRRHPHVVNFLGICHEPPCIVTEFCARGSLCDLLAAARSDPEVAAQLSWRRRLTMAADAAVGMLYLHSRSSPAPIIHRGELMVRGSGARLEVEDYLVVERLGGGGSDGCGSCCRPGEIGLCQYPTPTGISLPHRSSHSLACRPEEPQPAGGRELEREGEL